MTKAYQQFKINIDGLHNLTVIHEAFVDKVSPLDISDILRSQIVLAVSALDCYFHDLCEEAMLYIFENKNFATNNAFKNFAISMDTLHQMANSTLKSEKLFFLAKEIKQKNSYKSFQEPRKIAEALSFIGIKSIWVDIGKTLGKESFDLQKQLSLIVQRRNQIAHESDINPTLGLGEKYAISATIVKETIDFIKKIIDAIEQVVDREAILKP
ncbi:HEPN domain-containing protein [Sphingobacterium thalpophilum]|uniref:HEPN domain-containing protein n=1 Tax=Sphingobacterium thalpophilum TaxID=259 RepID=UPI0031D7D2D9